VNAFQSNVPPHLVQRWLGRASLCSTSIYAIIARLDNHPAMAHAIRTARSGCVHAPSL
jgi:hypothetical protein